MENRSLASRVGRNIGGFLIAWALFALAIRVGYRLEPAAQDALGLLGAGIGLAIAMGLHACIASILVGGFTLMIGVELLFHLIYGYGAVQSGPTHLAIMTASILGVALGSLSLRRFASLRSTTP